MTCDAWREQISARADGEEPDGSATRLLDAHLARCTDCRTYAEVIAAMSSPTPPTSAPPPDLPARVRRLNAAADRAASYSFARVLLTVVAAQIIVFSVPDLLGRNDALGEHGHSVRHLGAFAMAYAVGLLVVAVRPARARTMLPVSAVLVGALVIGAVVDLVQGRIPVINEVTHVPEIISVLLIWMIAKPSPEDTSADVAPAAASTLPPLRVVRDDPPRRHDVG